MTWTNYNYYELYFNLKPNNLGGILDISPSLLQPNSARTLELNPSDLQSN